MSTSKFGVDTSFICFYRHKSAALNNKHSVNKHGVKKSLLMESSFTLNPDDRGLLVLLSLKTMMIAMVMSSMEGV